MSDTSLVLLWKRAAPIIRDIKYTLAQIKVVMAIFNNYVLG